MRLPRALLSRTTSFNDSFCTSIAVTNTMSAHSISDGFSFSIFRSINLRSHESGSKADTVNKPSGGNAHRLPSNGRACLKLQYVSGNSGLTNKTFTRLLQLSLRTTKHYAVTQPVHGGLRRHDRSQPDRGESETLAASLGRLVATHFQYIARLALQRSTNHLKSIKSNTL